MNKIRDVFLAGVSVLRSAALAGVCMTLVVACGKKEPGGDSLVEIDVEQEEATVPAVFPAEMEAFQAAFEESALQYASATAAAAGTVTWLQQLAP